MILIAKSFKAFVIFYSIKSMDAYECIITKLDIREYSVQDVPLEIRQKILEAARLTGTGLNTQHWKFILVEKRENLQKLSEDSTSGSWVAGANFAIIGFGYPRKMLTGKKKNRKPINEFASYEKYDDSIQ